jgi:hypothetical protein
MQVLFCTKKGQPEWLEELLSDKPEHFEKAIIWAENNGYTVRVANINIMEKPNFVGTIKI